MLNPQTGPASQLSCRWPGQRAYWFRFSPLVEELKAQGFGVHYNAMLVPCLLYADDLVLIAESTEQLRAMMLHTSLFCRKWRFRISQQKTHVVIYGPRRTLASQDQVWTMAGMNIDMRQSYKYLGIHYENKGGWNEVITYNTKKAQQSMGQLPLGSWRRWPTNRIQRSAVENVCWHTAFVRCRNLVT